MLTRCQQSGGHTQHWGGCRTVPLLTALCAATERSAREAFNAQDVATTVWSLATLSSLRGMPLPRCYDDVEDCERYAAGSFNTGLCKLFHTSCASTVCPSVTRAVHPVWIINQANAWIMQVRDLHDQHASHTYQSEIAGFSGIN